MRALGSVCIYFFICLIAGYILAGRGEGTVHEGRAGVLQGVPAPAFIGVLTAVIVTFFQTRMAFSWDVLKFKFDRISPLKGFKRMFSLRSVIELLKSLIKITVLGWVVWFSSKAD